MNKRQELYAKVKQMGAEEAIKMNFGDNYTRISNADLETFLRGFGKKTKTTKKCTTTKYGDAIITLVSTLQAKKVLTPREAESIVATL